MNPGSIPVSMHRAALGPVIGIASVMYSSRAGVCRQNQMTEESTLHLDRAWLEIVFLLFFGDGRDIPHSVQWQGHPPLPMSCSQPNMLFNTRTQQ